MNFSKFVKAKQIKKELIKNAILFDPLVDKNFYCRKLKKLSINNQQMEILFHNIGNDVYSLMALLRGHQIGIIDEKFIYKVILNPMDIKWLINPVIINVHRLLGLDKIKIICHDNPGLYELAKRKRMDGDTFEQVYDFVQDHLIDLNKE